MHPAEHQVSPLIGPSAQNGLSGIEDAGVEAERKVGRREGDGEEQMQRVLNDAQDVEEEEARIPRVAHDPVDQRAKNSLNTCASIGHSGRGADTAYAATLLRRRTNVAQMRIGSLGEDVCRQSR